MRRKPHTRRGKVQPFMADTEYLNDFLNAMISDNMRESITDIFGKGTELDDSEGIQTVRKAKELLDKLAEYKPLAKIEELSIHRTIWAITRKKQTNGWQG